MEEELRRQVMDQSIEPVDAFSALEVGTGQVISTSLIATIKCQKRPSRLQILTNPHGQIRTKFSINFLLLTGWELRGIHCYKFFNIKHSWEKAAELCRRYVTGV